MFAQYHATHEIDSVMDMSPNYLPTYYTQNRTYGFEPLVYKQIDTGMISTHLYNPILKENILHQNLGICGQAHQSIIFDYDKEAGFLYQTLPYPLYFKKQSDLLLFIPQTTYSRVAYTLSFPKENEIFAVFAKNMKGVNVVANISSSVNEGTFVHQTVRNLCGDFLIHYELPSSIFGMKASYIINFLNNFENGGLLEIQSYQSRTAQSNAGYEVITPNANSKITTHDLGIQTYVNLKNKKKKYFGTFSYDFQFTQTTMIYHDEFDSMQYPYHGAYYSEKVTNDSVRFHTFKNALQWSNFSPNQVISSKNNFFYIAGGVLHDYTDLKNSDTTFNSFYLFARTHIRLFKLLDIKAKIFYSFYGYSKNDITANAEITCAINREKEHFVGVSANYYYHTPEYMMQYISTNNFLWDTLFQKQNILKLSVFWNYEKYNIAVNYYYLNKYVFLSEEFKPMQNKNNGNMVQVSTFIPFRYKNLGITANLNLQYCTKDVIKVPLFAGKIAVFYIFEFFKKRLKIQVGSDIMYNTAYYADAYLPVLHKFYSQNTQLVGNFVFMDANVTFRIDRINFFFRIGNLLAPVLNYRNYTTPNYPVKDFLISLGINWRFFD
ncbi:MAG: putative porin [Bacteroidales bacterium]|nr:putative porin [Bacteroidales bacterium]